MAERETSGAGQTRETSRPSPELRGRLVLASGAVVAVPELGIDVPTHHCDPTTGTPLPVVSRYVI